MHISIQVLHGMHLSMTAYTHLLSADAMLIDPQKATYIIAVDGETPIGAAALELNGTTYQECHIISLFVSETYRKQGVGTQLLEVIHNYAAANGIRQINIAYQENPADMHGMFTFLVKNGYTMPQIQGIIYHISVDELEKASLVTMRKIPANTACIYNQTTIAPHMLNQLITQAPDWVNPKTCLGKIMDEMTLYYVAGNEIKACVISELLEGKLNIHAVYTTSAANALHLYMLLQKLADMILKSKASLDFCEITMNAVNSNSQQLVEKLLEGAKITSDALQVSSYLVSPLAAPLDDAVALNHVWMQTISSLLTQMGVRHALRMNRIQFSDIVILTNPDKKIQINYFMDDETVSYLTAQTEGEETYITYELGTRHTDPEALYENFLKPLIQN